MGVTDWHELDYAKVAQVFGAATLSAGSSNWRGLYDPLAFPFNEPPEPAGAPENPTVFAVWGIDYEGEPLATFDRTIEPVRRGDVAVEVWVEVGAGMGPALDLFTQVRAAFTGQDGGGMQFFPDIGASEFLGVEGSFAGHRLGIPFAGGVG